MKRKPFVMQSICLTMILSGMHLCFYHAFLTAGHPYKFLICLTLGSFWFTLLTTAPFQRVDKTIKKRLHIPFIKNPAADFLLLLTVICAALFFLKF
jgi:hypothetical protein